MKSIIAIIFLMMTSLIAGAQYSWKVSLNTLTILSSSESDEVLNTKKIKSTEWKKNGYLEVSFKEMKPSGWLHSLQFTDESGNQLLLKDSVMEAKIAIPVLRKLFAGKKQLKIYMLINPPDPFMLAPSRIVHLCTLKLP
jgi:hypothetical protein